MDCGLARTHRRPTVPRWAASSVITPRVPIPSSTAWPPITSGQWTSFSGTEALATLGVIDARDAAAKRSGRPVEPGGDGPGAPASRYEALVDAAINIREGYEAAIKERFPRTWRNSAGYRLNYLLPWSSTRPPGWEAPDYPPYSSENNINLASLMAGSEGTLAVIRRATVGLVPKPDHSILAVLSYPSIESACEAVPEILTRHPSAIELIPRMIVDLARQAPAFAMPSGWAGAEAEALLVVEFAGDNPGSLKTAAEALQSGVRLAESASDQARVWSLRKAGLGILDSRPQSARSIGFIEDCAIPIENLGEFAREARRIMVGHKAEGGIYGHASAGCLHVRPILDLKTLAGVRTMREIADEIVGLALRLGGSMASEHGDGIARGEWLRKTYGDDIAAAMSSLKLAADPAGILSPSKMLAAPPMDTHLRYGAAYHAQMWKAGIDFGRNGGLGMAIEQCNGQAVCRKDDGVMCPSFQATREEEFSTRGRANLLRALISSGTPIRSAKAESSAVGPGRDGLTEAVFRALDLCLGCKGCKAECPSGVDMAKLKAAFLDEYYRARPRSLRDYAFGYFHVTAQILQFVAPFTNTLNQLPVARRALARALGIAQDRPFPTFANRLARPHQQAGPKPVILLRDPFNHYVNSDVEQAALDLLGLEGFDVRILHSMGAGASLVSKGFLAAAQRHAETLVTDLQRADPTHFIPLATIEPSELSTLRHDYPDLLPALGPAVREQVVGARSVEELLQHSGGLKKLRVATINTPILFHPHCHEQSDHQPSELVRLGRAPAGMWVFREGVGGGLLRHGRDFRIRSGAL